MTDAADPRILGSLGSADGTGVVRIEDRYDTDIDDLWEALTDPARLARWYGEVEGDLRPGGQFRTYIAANDIEATGRVEACEPPRRLLLTSKETDESYRRGQGVPPFDTTIEATLTADGDQTILVIEVRGMPLDKIAFYGAGWQIHAENLASYLAGMTPATPKPAGASSSLAIWNSPPGSTAAESIGAFRSHRRQHPASSSSGSSSVPHRARCMAVHNRSGLAAHAGDVGRRRTADPRPCAGADVGRTRDH